MACCCPLRLSLGGGAVAISRLLLIFSEVSYCSVCPMKIREDNVVIKWPVWEKGLQGLNDYCSGDEDGIWAG